MAKDKNRGNREQKKPKKEKAKPAASLKYGAKASVTEVFGRAQEPKPKK